jgi:hypothetical protein
VNGTDCTQVANNGMDAMMMRLLDEASLILAQDDDRTLNQGLSNSRIDYIW